MQHLLIPPMKTQSGKLPRYIRGSGCSIEALKFCCANARALRATQTYRSAAFAASLVLSTIVHVTNKVCPRHSFRDYLATRQCKCREVQQVQCMNSKVIFSPP